MDRIVELLKENGIKPSVQRIRIYEYLMDNYDHPTVDKIYGALGPSMPTLSKTTIYNTLKLFVEKQIVRAIHVDDSEQHFDAIMDFHGHFQCSVCRKIFDIDLEIDAEAMRRSLDGFEVRERQFMVFGVCKECKKS